jgi:hypothetical protein
MDVCPSSFVWDDHEIHGTPFPEPVARHVDSCPRCQLARERRHASRQLFAARFAVPLRQRMASASARRRWTLWPVSLFTAAGVAACLLLTLHVRRAGSGPYVAAKGDVAIELDLRRNGRVFLIDTDLIAQPGDELQLAIRAASGLTYASVGSVDGTGRFSPFYPPTLDGMSAELPRHGRVFEPPVVLDDAPGPERIVIVLSGAPLHARDIARWAESAVVNQPVPMPSPIAGPQPVVVRWVTLRKKSAGR